MSRTVKWLSHNGQVESRSFADNLSGEAFYLALQAGTRGLLHMVSIEDGAALSLVDDLTQRVAS